MRGVRMRSTLVVILPGLVDSAFRRRPSLGINASLLKSEPPEHSAITYESADAVAHAERPAGLPSKGMVFLSTQQARARRRGTARETHKSRNVPEINSIDMSAVVPPTAFPPNPPTIDGWLDMQPVDTSLGILFVSRFAEQPTITPPPSQSSLLDVSFACPLMSEWPDVVEIDSLDPCGVKSQGNWSFTGGRQDMSSWIMKWTLTCDLFEGGTAPVVTYKMPNGDFFGTSTVLTSLVGNTIALRDCAGNVKYYIEEKVYHEAGEVNSHACQKYLSCDGTVWLQYIIKDENSDVVGRTQYLHLFQDEVMILNADGSIAAEAQRIGQWSPRELRCGGNRKWRITFPTQASGKFADATNQWPIAELINMMAIRDEYRYPNGLTAPTACEVWKFGVRFVILLFCTMLVLGGGVVFFKSWIGHTRTFLVNLENELCPLRMKKQSRFEGNEQQAI